MSRCGQIPLARNSPSPASRVTKSSVPRFSGLRSSAQSPANLRSFLMLFSSPSPQRNGNAYDGFHCDRTVVAAVKRGGAARSKKEQFNWLQSAAIAPGNERSPCSVPLQGLSDRDTIDVHEASPLAYAIACDGTDALEQGNGHWKVPAW